MEICVNNSPSLIAIVGYAYENYIDLDEWIIDWFKGNKMYLLNQKKNFLHMKKSVDLLKENQEEKTAQESYINEL